MVQLLAHIGTGDVMQSALVHVVTGEKVLSAIRSRRRNIVQLNVNADIRTTAHHRATDRIVLVASRTMDVVDPNARDRQVGRVLVAGSEVLLPITLRDFDGVVDVPDEHVLVGDIVDSSETATTLQVF